MTRRVLAIVAATLLMTSPSSAQRVQPEARVDALEGRPGRFTVQPGAGAIVALGYYARVSADVGYAVRRDVTFIDDRWRADLLTRVTLDPFREQRWALSIGGGLSVRRRTHLAAIADVEGPETRGWLPALQVGVSGGVRAGVALRRAIKGRR